MSDGETGSGVRPGDDSGRGGRGGTSAEKDHWLARPSTIRLLWGVFVAVLLVTVVPDFFIHQHVHFGVEDFFGFYAAYGFGTCVLMVVGAKALGLLIKRGDDYYDG